MACTREEQRESPPAAGAHQLVSYSWSRRADTMSPPRPSGSAQSSSCSSSVIWSMASERRFGIVADLSCSKAATHAACVDMVRSARASDPCRARDTEAATAATAAALA